MKKRIKKLMFLTCMISFGLLGISCSNNSDVSTGNSNNDKITTNDNDSTDRYEDIDKYIENDDSSYNPSILRFGKEFYRSFLISNDVKYNEKYKDETNVDIYFGSRHLASFSKYDKDNGWEVLTKKKTINSTGETVEEGYFGEFVPLFYEQLMKATIDEEKQEEYLNNKVKYKDWENNATDFDQELKLSIYRLIYKGKATTDNIELVKKDKIYSYKDCFGYFCSYDFDLSQKNKIEDKININDLSTDEDGYGFVRYELEITPVNDEYIKLGAVWKKDELYTSKVIKNYNQETGELEITYEKVLKFKPGDFVSGIESVYSGSINLNERTTKISVSCGGHDYIKTNSNEIIRRYHSDYEHQMKLENPLYPLYPRDTIINY